MSRQLKFRVYIPDHEKFTHFQLGDFDYSDRYLHQHEYPVQQFIGACDKNGKEIYEGDIVKYTIKPNQLNFDIANKYFFADVVWHEYTLSFGCITKCKYTDLSEDTFCSFDDLIRHMESLEVVGNIFELPCKPDHNGECMVCDCWLSDCPLRK